EGTAILTWEGQAGQAGDQWFFLPALRKAKRVASGGRRVRFMGTDFAYEDLAPEDPSAWTYASAGEGDVDGAPCWLVDATPASASLDTGYSKRRLSIRKDNLYIVRRELFDSAGKLAKVQSDRKLVQVAGSAWRADEITMEDKGASTARASRKTCSRPPHSKPARTSRDFQNSRRNSRSTSGELSGFSKTSDANLMRKLCRWIIFHQRISVALVLVVTALLATGLPGLRTEVTAKDLMAADSPAGRFYEDAKRQFGSDDLTLVLVQADDVFQPKA